MRFCANVSILFRDAPLLDRFDRAARAGFEAVELWWPAGEDLAAVERRIKDAGLAVALMNFAGGDLAAGDRGLAADPDRFRLFRENVPVALDLASRTGCRRLNALVGKELPGLDRDRQ
ncbi:MAG TPA: TIM barrel protein, partial [Dehalococcoidia bacterium]|nr:TIM barrel protein [Dehalococcoidia bacterium]